MKSATKLSLMSLGLVCVMTFAIQIIGIRIIYKNLYSSENRILQLELSASIEKIRERLYRSGTRAATQLAAEEWNRIRAQSDLPEATLFIVDKVDQRVVFHPAIPEGEKIKREYISRMFESGKGSVSYGEEKESYIAAFDTLEPIGWLIAVTLNGKEIRKHGTEYRRAIVFTSFILLCAGALVMNIVSRGLLKRVKATLECVNRIGAGDISARIETAPKNDELGALQKGINAMGRSLEQRTREREEAREELRYSEERLQSFVEQSPMAIVIIRNAAVLYANSRFAATFGFDAPGPLIGNRVADFFIAVSPQDSYERPNETMYEAIGKRVDGSTFQVQVTASRIMLSDGPASIGFVQNIDERKRNEREISRLNTELSEKMRQLMDAQEELLRKEKLSVLGQMAGIVGHELRNPLGVMSNAVYFLKMTIPETDTKTIEYLDLIKGELERSQRIIGDLLDFARTKSPNAECVSVNDLIEYGLRLCDIPETISVHRNIAQNLPEVFVDPQQMEQVIQNLTTNAVQAMNGTGTLTFRGFTGEGSDMVSLSVIDSGPGLSPEVRDKLFQPLITTKARGIGLGLVVCKNIVTANGGDLRADDSESGSARFTITLPRYKEAARCPG